MNPDSGQMKRHKINFAPSCHITACMTRILLLKTSVETEKFSFQGALIFDALARWSNDLLKETRPTGEVLPGSSSGPGCPVSCGAAVARHKTQNSFFKNSGFASGFFEGKPRGKTYKQKHLRRN
jgi:hypothetical protein